MGLRARILLAFCVLGVLPLFITGALGYVLSARLVEAVAAARAQSDVQLLARDLDRLFDAGDTLPVSGLRSGTWQRADGARSPLTRTFVVDNIGVVVPIDGRGAANSAETGLALDVARGLGRPHGADRIVTLDGTRWVAASASLPDPRWTLVGLGSLEVLTGLTNRAHWVYLGFVVAVVLCIGAGLVFLVRPIVRALEDLTEAANLIGDGDLAPWLPPHAEGEVGRLSQATGAMVERVERMMRGVEQGARMAMVGELATHLAHEIRNPLSSIKLNLQSLGRELARGRIPTDVNEVTDLCLHEIERLDRVATSVLLVGRARERRPAPENLHEPLRRAVSILGGEMSRRRISMYLDVLADRDDVFADRESMQSVFLNLLVNAAESIGEDGSIRVVSRTRRDEAGRGWIRIEVEDSGPGVPEHIRDRVFDPFYTTKPDGTGVGLATSLETVAAHGGSLFLATPTKQSGGAAFVVELPLRNPDLTAPPPRKAHVAEPHPDHRG